MSRPLFDRAVAALADAAVYVGFIAWWAISSWLGAMDTGPTVGIALAGCFTIRRPQRLDEGFGAASLGQAVALALAFFVPLVLLRLRTGTAGLRWCGCSWQHRS